MQRNLERETSNRLKQILLVLLAAALACGQGAPAAGATPTFDASTSGSSPNVTVPSGNAQAPILVGTEYVLIENPRRVQPLATMLAPIGLAAAKPLPENFSWQQMQPTPDSKLNFTRLDEFVTQFQAAGINTIVLALKALSNWATKDGRVEGSFFPLKGGIKEEYLDDYENWVGAVVERYDGDGQQDMPGLRAPVRYYEIGTEFSSYEPEPVDEYLDILGRAYRAAHAAYSDVLIAHVAFLLTPALFNVLPDPGDYDAAFNALVDKNHTLADMRKILDHPELFDVLNFHSLGHPYEIEAIVDWLNYETGQRGYSKPMIISDTGSTPFVAWGAATACNKPAAQMGRVVPPATDADRCRLADYFTKLVNADADTLRWTREFIAADTVKRIVVAAEQRIVLIDTAFTEDLLLLKLGIAQAGAGTAAWAGLVDFDRKEYRPVYYVLQQLISQLGDYESITRLDTGDDGIRVYEVTRGGQRFWIAWYDPRKLTLPGEAVPQATYQLNVGTASAMQENLAIAASGQQQENLTAVDGRVTLSLTPSPIFIFPGN